MTFEKEFNKFIKNWCGNHYAHLVNTNENEGQHIRNYVEENYIPKQKVKDAIEKAEKECGFVETLIGKAFDTRYKWLKKELGLK